MQTGYSQHLCPGLSSLDQRYRLDWSGRPSAWTLLWSHNDRCLVDMRVAESIWGSRSGSDGWQVNIDWSEWGLNVLYAHQYYSSVHQVIGQMSNPNPRRALRGAITSLGLGLVGIQYLGEPMSRCALASTRWGDISNTHRYRDANMQVDPVEKTPQIEGGRVWRNKMLVSWDRSE